MHKPCNKYDDKHASRLVARIEPRQLARQHVRLHEQRDVNLVPVLEAVAVHLHLFLVLVDHQLTHCPILPEYVLHRRLPRVEISLVKYSVGAVAPEGAATTSECGISVVVADDSVTADAAAASRPVPGLSYGNCDNRINVEALQQFVEKH